MSFIIKKIEKGIATLTFNRGKVNAINEDFVDQLDQALKALEHDGDVRAIILTGQGKFFSFGFDIPEFLSRPRDDFRRFLSKFTALYAYMFLYPKPLIAAINGHAIAGGCMLTNCCDFRIMVSGKAKISLNELGLGASVFAGSVDILKYRIGGGKAQEVLFSAAMYSAEQAAGLGLVEQVVSEAELYEVAGSKAQEYAGKDMAAFASIKRLLRKPVVDGFKEREAEANEEFLDIWYSESTWRNLLQVKIRE